MPQKKIPLRMCVGCREMKPKKELLRVAKPEDAEAHIDLTGKAKGRGAYVCPNADCLKKAMKSKALDRALECSISEEVFNSLTTQIAEALRV